MSQLDLAIVHKQIPERHGVQVIWRNLDHQAAPNAGKDGYGFARCGVSRAHPTLASVTDLPAVGEMGLVATIDDEVCIWLCSIHMQDDNAIAYTTDEDGFTKTMKLNRHDSGITTQENEDGEWQASFPGGTVVRSTIDDVPMVVPAGPRLKNLGAGIINWMAIDHPSGLTIKISPAGDVLIDRAGTIDLTAANPIAITGYGTFNLQTLPITDNPNAADDWGEGYVQPSMDINITAGDGAGVHGKVTITSGGDTVVNAGGNLALNATGTVNLQGGSARFLMEGFATWAKTHTHTSAASGSATSAAIPDPTSTASYFSATTLKGKTG